MICSTDQIIINSSTLPTYLTTTTTAAILSNSTTIPVTANAAFSGAGYYAKITSTNGTEIVFVSSGGSSANMNVLRGLGGTTAIAHTTAATISTNVGGALGSLLADIYITLQPVF